MPNLASVGTGRSPCRMAKKTPTRTPNASCRKLSVGMVPTSPSWDATVARSDSPGASSPGRRAVADQVLRDRFQPRFEGVDDGPHAARPCKVGMDHEPQVVDLDRRVGEYPPKVPVGIADVAGKAANADAERNRPVERERIAGAEHDPGVGRFLARDPGPAERPRFEHHHVVAGEAVALRRARMRGEIAFRRIGRLGDSGHAPRDQLAAFPAHVPGGHVRLPPRAGQAGRAGRQIHTDLRVDLVQRPDGRQDHGLSEHLGGGDAHDACELSIRPQRPLLDEERRLLHLLRGGADALARLGQDQALRRALEELRAEVLLERGEPASDGRVVDAQLPRGGGKGAGAAQLEEVAEIAPVCHRHALLHGSKVKLPGIGPGGPGILARLLEEVPMLTAAVALRSLEERTVAVDARKRARWTLSATSFGLSMALLDMTAVNVAVPSIQAGLNTDVLGLSWVIDGYTLTFASLLLLSGGLGDRLGAKRLFLSGLVVFTVASAACGFAPGLDTLVFARIVQGAGAAMFMPSSLAILREAYPHAKERAHAIGIWSALTAIAGACGPLFGGALVASLGWRSIFLLNLPVGIVAVPMVVRFVRPSPAGARRGFDLPAQIAGAFALALLTWALIERSAFGWSSPRILLALVASAGALLAFLELERRSPNPILPLQLFANRTFSATASAALLYAGGFFGSVLVFSIYFQSLRGDSPIRAGLHMAAVTISFGLTSVVAGRFAGRYGTRMPILVGLSLLAAGALLFASLAQESSFAVLALPLVLFVTR